MKTAKKRNVYGSLEKSWREVTPFDLVAYYFFSFLVLVSAHIGTHMVAFLDTANHGIHEVGHTVFVLFSDALFDYGGALAQVLVPMVMAFLMFERRDTLSFSICLLWLGENLFNIAYFMADARAKLIPLSVKNDEDWTLIFTRWDALESDTNIALAVRVCGWLMIIGVGIWLWLHHKNAEA